MPFLKLQSSDGEVFQVETQIAKQSNTIRTMLEGKYPFDCNDIKLSQMWL